MADTLCRETHLRRVMAGMKQRYFYKRALRTKHDKVAYKHNKVTKRLMFDFMVALYG